MSTVQDSQTVWSVTENVNSKYEKCLNITEEIYKRINITFQIKKLETATQSDVSDLSDQIDSNELSNETDLFACDKSSISSSEESKPAPAKYININNNEEKPRPAIIHKRPKKRFRKRVKKRQSKHQSESDGSSDEALPLSRIVDIDIDKCASEGKESPDNIMGVPNILILAKDSKSKLQQDKKLSKKDSKETDVTINDKSVKPESKKGKDISKSIDKKGKERELTDSPMKEVKTSPVEMKSCPMCSLSFRGERGFRRHMTMSHSISDINIRHEGENEKPV